MTPRHTQHPDASAPLLGSRSLGRLHVITDARPERDPIRLARLALEGGAPVIQVRAKGLADRELYEMAASVAALCREYGATCIVNDRADIALAVGAAGVHVGADDLPVANVRRILGETAVVGGTARDPETARRLEAEGASYLGVGPVYATSTKIGLPPPIGLERVRAVTGAVSVPVIAIAGVTVDRVPELLAAGVHGVAVVSAIADAPDPRRATQDFLAALERET